MQVPVAGVAVGRDHEAARRAEAAREMPSSASAWVEEAAVLLAPARGYGDAPAAERAQVLNKRLEGLRELGPEGMARARSAAMLAPGADPALVEAVRG